MRWALVRTLRAATRLQIAWTGDVGRPAQNGSGDADEVRVPIGQRYAKLVEFLGITRSMGFGEEALVGFTSVFLDTSVEVDEQRKPLNREDAERAARDIARRYPGRLNR